jgi:hypothetical protein
VKTELSQFEAIHNTHKGENKKLLNTTTPCELKKLIKMLKGIISYKIRVRQYKI